MTDEEPLTSREHLWRARGHIAAALRSETSESRLRDIDLLDVRLRTTLARVEQSTDPEELD